MVESWAEYQAKFGGLDARSLMSYSVYHFFSNGGTQAYIIRLVWDGSVPAAVGTNPAVAKAAVVTGLGYASAYVTASSGAITSPPVPVSVGTPVLKSLIVSPAVLPPVPVGSTVQFSATGVNSDGSAAAAPATWESSDPSILSFGAGGLATANAAGTVTVTAKSGLVSGSTTVAVTTSPISTFTVIALTPNLAIGQTQQLVATFGYADGTTQDVTSMVTWTPSAGGKATVSPAGLVTGVSAGSATITAQLPVLSGVPGPKATFAATVGALVPVAIRIYPGNAVLKSAGVATFTAMATMSDGSAQKVVGGAWTCDNATVATIAANGGDPDKEDATAVAIGSATVTVASGALTASATVKVIAANLTSIQITPVNPSVPLKRTLQLKALGIYDDGTNVDLTEAVGWTAGSGATADPNTGLVLGTTVNPAVTITAKWQGVTATANLAVTAPALLSIAVTPAPVNLASGASTPLKATGTFSDGSTADITATATWLSSATSIASVSAGIVTAHAPGGALTLFAANPGIWGNNLRVTVTPQTADPKRFSLLVQLLDPVTGQLKTLESFVNLSTVSTDANYVVTVIDEDSEYVTFIDPVTSTLMIPTAAPAATLDSAGLPAPVALSGGTDGTVLIPATDLNFELALTFNATAGVYLLERVDIFNLLCVPGETDAPTISTLQTYCAEKRAFYLVDAPAHATTAGLRTTGPVGSTIGPINSGTAAANSAFYYPWVEAPDPLAGNRPALFPPCGFVAGIIAATDATRGVWKAPAGLQAGLAGTSGLQESLTDLENGGLNIQGINCLRGFKLYGNVVWGARTLVGSDAAGSQWKYVPIRRLALYIESSLYVGTQWVVFEPNDEPLWSQIRLNVGVFMNGLFKQGAFQGTTPSQAYYVKCDADNNPQSSIDLGVVNIEVGFLPLFPAEFVVIQLQQMAGKLS
jgi:hypothetical protein